MYAAGLEILQRLAYFLSFFYVLHINEHAMRVMDDVWLRELSCFPYYHALQ